MFITDCCEFVGVRVFIYMCLCVCVCVCICMCYSVHLKYEIRENSAAGRHPGRLQKQLFSTQGCTRCKRCYCITRASHFYYTNFMSSALHNYRNESQFHYQAFSMSSSLYLLLRRIQILNEKVLSSSHFFEAGWQHRNND